MGARWGFFNPANGETIRVLMLTFEKQSLAGKLLKLTYADKQRPGVNILGSRHKLVPFPPREDKATKQKVGKALRESQRGIKGLREVHVPKVRYPLSAAEEVIPMENLPHCLSLSTFQVGSKLRYLVMVQPDPESAAYTTANVQDGIRQAYPDLIDDTWMDPMHDASGDGLNDTEDSWDGRAEVPADLQRLAWESCKEGTEEGGDPVRPMHRWAHIKPPSTKQHSRKKFFMVVYGRFPWSSGGFFTWADCYRHVKDAKRAKFMGFNSRTEAVKWWKEQTGSDPVCPRGQRPACASEPVGGETLQEGGPT